MIDHKYETKTKKFFVFQQIIYVFFFIFPFFALQTWSPNSWPYLISSQLAQMIFFAIELLILSKEDAWDYWMDVSNIPDWV
jgi:hypothetical protein